MGRRKTSGADVPTPTANFKSYRRVSSSGSSSAATPEAARMRTSRVTNSEETQGGHRQLKFPASRQKQPAPLPNQAASKNKSVTRLSFDGPPRPQSQYVRADSGLGHSSVSSVSSLESSSVQLSQAHGPASPVRILVKQEQVKNKRPSSAYYE